MGNKIRNLVAFFLCATVALTSGIACGNAIGPVGPTVKSAEPGESDEGKGFKLKPEFTPNVPVRFIHLLNETEIVVSDRGNAYAEASDLIRTAAGINWEKGEVLYTFKGRYDYSKKKLSGKISLRYNTKETGENGPYCKIKYVADLDLNATFVSEDKMEGKAVGKGTNVQTFLGEYATNAPPETSSWDYDWKFVGKK